MNLNNIDSKWQKIWDEKNCFKTEIDESKEKYYVLEMFPYPSGKIHVGHLRNYSIGDVVARFNRMKGKNVLYPMGWDAFGLPAENAAIKNNVHPEDWTVKNIASMREQLKSMGNSYDWSREIATCSPDYYKHEQAFFIELFEKGLAYQKESEVNWDPVDKTVLANEQVVEGRGWRSGALVERKKLKQWFLKITNYSEELLSAIDTLGGWPESVRYMQTNWIGKSEGCYIDFKLENSDDVIKVYTTKPETIFGCSYLAISYDHDILEKHEQSDEVKHFMEKYSKLSISSEERDKMEKEGVKTNINVIHPLTSEVVPVYIANFVLKDYGTGAVFACPANDQRDHDFAKKYNLPVIEVIQNYEKNHNFDESAYTEDGIIVNSNFLNDLNVKDARKKIISEFEKLGKGNGTTQYRLNDWGVSRQRYWGTPIPMIYCESCGVVPEKLENLPVTLPKDVKFSGKGNPLDEHPSWKNVKCPKCGSDAQRETDTFDTFFESSWYFTRFCDPSADTITNKDACDYWMSVDRYIGGVEHAVLHLLYARFFTKLMKDLGHVKVDEPFKNLLTQGMVLHASYKDVDGDWIYPSDVEKRDGKLFSKSSGKEVFKGKIEKMSKSKNNVVDLESILKEFGADTLRMFILSDSPPERDLEWSDSGVEGCYRFILKLYKFADKIVTSEYTKDEIANLESQIHLTIKSVSSDIDNYHLNKALARIRELFNAAIASDKTLSISINNAFTTILKLLNPFIPHITEEIWEKIGNKDILAETVWPKFDESKIDNSTQKLAIQVNGKLRGTIEIDSNASKDEIESMAKEHDVVSKYLENITIMKTIIVPGKIVNFVVKQ